MWNWNEARSRTLVSFVPRGRREPFLAVILSKFSTPPSSETFQMPSTIRLHRVLRTTPEKLYRAFLDSDAKAKWLPPYGFTCKVHHSDDRVGGTYKMSFTNFTTGASHSFGGSFIELVPNELIRYNDRFDDPNLPGELHVTVTIK